MFENENIYPTFSLGSLSDFVHVNFGQTQFTFNLKAKVEVSLHIISNDPLEILRIDLLGD